MARDLFCGPKPEGMREAALRKTLFSLADRHPVDFDMLCDKIVAILNARAIVQAPRPRSANVEPT